MSCEENRLRYFERLSMPGGALAGALGGESEARATLEQIFHTARSDGAIIRSPLQQHRAAGRTLQLFEEMEKQHGLSRPTHSTTGMRLPKRDAQFGYQAVYDTIEAARAGKALPEVAVRIMQQRRLRRSISAVRMDDRGYYRCSNCGQFASRTREHICPFTATAGDLARALRRRLGTPDGAYVYTDHAGLSTNGLQCLIDEARGHHAAHGEPEAAANAAQSTSSPLGALNSSPGTVRMIHCLTGEEVDVTLDGAIPALSQGFLPGAWAGLPCLRQAELPDRRVVAVLNAQGLNTLEPVGAQGAPGVKGPIHGLDAPGVPGTSGVPGALDTPGVYPDAAASSTAITSALQAAAASYGVLLPPGTPVRSLGAPGPLQASEAFGETSSPDDVPLAVPARSGIASPGKPVLLRPTTLHGGVSYDWGRFTGTEYRKSGWHGTQVYCCGQTYTVGSRHTDPAHWSHARRSGAEPAPKGGVAVGRTLLAAVDLLVNGQIARNGHGVQLYNADRSELISVYDPATQTAGDTLGSQNASPEQLAAVIAYWHALGRSAGGAQASPASNSLASLAHDLDRLRAGSGSPLAAADSAYLAMRDHMKGSSLTLGARVDTPRCPDCGRWMGDAHVCPARADAPPPASKGAVPRTAQQEALPPGAATPTAPTSPAISSPASPAPPASPASRGPGAGPESELMPRVEQAEARAGLTPEAAAAIEQLGERIGDRLGRHIDSRLTAAPGAAPAADDRMSTALDRLAGILETWSQREAASPSGFSPAAVSDPSPALLPSETPASSPTAPTAPTSSPAPSLSPSAPSAPARPSFDVLPLTPQEHILRHVKPPEPPDPYLSRLDSSLGGKRHSPLALHFEQLDPTFDVGASSEKALRIVSSSLQIAWDSGRKHALRGTHMRVFGFAGTAGTGKNTTARQLAATLGLPYYETTLHRDTSLQEEIGQTVLQNGTSMPRLGPLGQAAAAGGVICINELVKANPGTLGALQRMMEDGVFEVQGTEAGMAAKEIPVHPSTVFICTWNPGYDGSSDRPDAALLSRIPTIRMDAPDIKDETRRIVGSLGALFGLDDEQSAETGGKAPAGMPSDKARLQKQERMQEILSREYSITRAAPSPERVEIAVRFVRDLRNLAQTRQIGASSRHLLEPTPREALHFAAMCEATGDPLLALEQFKIYCDSGESYEEQFKLVQQIFKRYYGEDGQALNRRASGQGPQSS